MDNINRISGREKLNAAFGDIDLSFVEFAESPPARSRNTLKGVWFAAACVAIVLAMLPFVMKISINEPPVVPNDGNCPHEFTTVYKELLPTCESAGIRYIKCNADGCDYTYTEQFGEPLGHDLQRGETTLPQCEKGGFTVYRCTREGCDFTELRDYTEAKGHGALNTVSVDSGCLTVGYVADRCADCGKDTNKREIIPAAAHEFTADGNGFVCSLCGEARGTADMPLDYGRLVEYIEKSGLTLSVYGNYSGLPLGAVTAEEGFFTLDDGRFTVALRAMEELIGADALAEIRNDGEGAESYLRITQNAGSAGAYITAEVDGEREKAVTVEFSLRLGKADSNGKYIAWNGAWESTDETKTQGVMALWQDENGVLSFGNSDFSLKLSEHTFTRVKLVYRFSENAYDIYIDGTLCEEGALITEDGAEALEDFVPYRFWYAATLSFDGSEERYIDLGGFISYRGEAEKEEAVRLTHSELIESIKAAGKTVLVNGDLNELLLGTLVQDMTLDDHRFIMILGGVAKIRKDGSREESYLRITYRGSSAYTAMRAVINGKQEDEIAVEFSIRLGQRDVNGGYVEWKGGWRSKKGQEDRSIQTMLMDKNGVLSFGNTDFSLKLGDESFTRIKLVYRFSENSYEVYIDGILRAENVAIAENAEELDGFNLTYFYYATVAEDSSVDVRGGSYDLGSFVAYR